MSAYFDLLKKFNNGTTLNRITHQLLAIVSGKSNWKAVHVLLKTANFAALIKASKNKDRTYVQ